MHFVTKLFFLDSLQEIMRMILVMCEFKIKSLDSKFWLADLRDLALAGMYGMKTPGKYISET